MFCMDILLGGYDLCLYYFFLLKEKVIMKSYWDCLYVCWWIYVYSCMSDIYRVRVLILLCLVFGFIFFIS